MALIEIHAPSKREVRIFGLLVALFFGLIGGVVWFKGWRTGEPSNLPFVLWGTGVALAALYYAVPPLRLVIYYGWLKLVYPIGWTISHLMLLVTYYLVVTPIGLVMRLSGYDPMHRRCDPEASTHWVEHKPGRKPARYFRQF